MTKYAEELDTATAVLAAARADRAIADRRRGPAAAARGGRGRRCTRSTRSTTPRRSPTGMATPGCRWRVRGLRWWRSSRSPSSPPRSGSPPTPGSGTSVTPWSWATASRGCGAAWSPGTCGRTWRGGSPTRPSRSHPTAASFVDRHVAPCGAQDRTRPAGTPRRRGDRHPHAGAGRGTAAGEGGRPVLHRRGPAGLLRRHRRRCTGSSTWPTPSTSNTPSPGWPPS